MRKIPIKAIILKFVRYTLVYKILTEFVKYIHKSVHDRGP